MPRRPDLPCAECGQLMWRGTTSLPAGKARCLPCRRARPTVPDSRHSRMCADCGSPCYGVRCKACDTKRRIVRSPSDPRRERAAREAAAPGMTRAKRESLLRTWRAERRACAYCGDPATTVDHVVPLVRGGTNWEGNLAPACRKCNGSKAGYLVIEWRSGLRLPPMTDRLPWLGKPPKKRKTPVARGLTACAHCQADTQRPRFCSDDCSRDYFRIVMRSRYRERVGLPVDTPARTYRRAG